MMAVLRQIAYGSAEYRQECALRDEVLRRPLGLSLQDEDLTRERDQLHVGLFDDRGALIGCAIAVPFGDGTAKVRQMAVAGGQRRQGHGREIMTGLEAYLARRGIAKVILHARVSAAGFYEKLGYLAEGEPFIEVTIPHLRMSKRLPP